MSPEPAVIRSGIDDDALADPLLVIAFRESRRRPAVSHRSNDEDHAFEIAAHEPRIICSLAAKPLGPPDRMRVLVGAELEM